MMRTTPSCSRGAGLIEVMVASLVLALGLLGIAGLQASAIANNLSAWQYSQATALAQAMIERMRANRAGVLAGHYLRTATAAAPVADVDCSLIGSRCSPEQQADWDLAMLYAQLSADAALDHLPAGPRAILPGGRLSISCASDCAAPALQLVTIYWDASRNGASGTDCRDDRSQLHCLRLGFVP